MNTPVISATGLWTPPNSISNEELVNSYNMWADIWNRERGADISAGVIEPKTHSSVEFIEKASGIKSRYVIDKTGILDPDIMAPRIAERPNDRISVLAEIAVHAARDALADEDRRRKKEAAKNEARHQQMMAEAEGRKVVRLMSTLSSLDPADEPLENEVWTAKEWAVSLDAHEVGHASDSPRL